MTSEELGALEHLIEAKIDEHNYWNQPSDTQRYSERQRFEDRLTEARHLLTTLRAHK